MDDLLFKNRNKEYGAYKLRKLYNKTLAFSLLISVICTLLFVLVPFVLNLKEQYKEDFVIRTNIVAVELMPIEEIKKNELKPQAKPVKPLIIEKPEDKTELVKDSTLNNPNQKDSLIEAEKKKKAQELEDEIEENKAIFSIVKGQAFSKWVNENFNRNLLINNKLNGCIILKFYINERGIVDSAKVIKGLSPILDNEAKRVILSSPRWKPFIYKGLRRRIEYTIPINIVSY